MIRTETDLPNIWRQSCYMIICVKSFQVVDDFVDGLSNYIDDINRYVEFENRNWL